VVEKVVPPADTRVHVREYPPKDTRHVIPKRIPKNSLSKTEGKNNRIKFAI